MQEYVAVGQIVGWICLAIFVVVVVLFSMLFHQRWLRRRMQWYGQVATARIALPHKQRIIGFSIETRERERENVSDARTNYTWFWVTFRCLLKFPCSARLRFHEVSMLYACVCSARRELTSIPYIGLLVVLFMNFDICLIHFNWNWMLDLDMPMPCLPLLPWCDVAILFSFLMPSICSALRMALALYLRWNCYVFNGNIFWRYINIHTANVVAE